MEQSKREKEENQFVTRAELKVEIESLAGMMQRGFESMMGAMREGFQEIREEMRLLRQDVKGVSDRTESIESALRQDQERLDRVEQKVGIES